MVATSHQRRSEVEPSNGIEYLLSVPIERAAVSRSEAHAFWRKVRADISTRRRWQSAKQVRVWEGVALLYGLDPDVIALRRSSSVGYLKAVTAFLQPNCLLARFVQDIAFVAADANSGKLRTLPGGNAPLQKFTTLEWCAAYACGTHRTCEVKMPMQGDGQEGLTSQSRTTPLLAITERCNAIYAANSRDERVAAKKVHAFLQSQGVSNRKIDVISSIVRNPELKPGAYRKYPILATARKRP